jgi:hypothetical protein
MRLSIVVTATVLGAALAVVAVGVAGSEETAGATRTLSFQGKNASGGLIDIGDQGLSPGDPVVVTEQLMSGGRTVGRVDTICTMTHTPPRARCAATAVLPGGDISTVGILVNPTQPHTEAITGGTGKFKQARGTAKIRPGTGGDDVTFKVLP